MHGSENENKSASEPSAPSGDERARWTAEQIHDRLVFASRATAEGLWDWDAVSDRVYYSPQLAEIFGIMEGEAAAARESFLRRMHPSDQQRFLDFCAAAQGTEHPHFEGAFRLMHADGLWRHVLLRAVRVHGPRGELTRIVGTLHDVTRHCAHDELTGLLNRSAMIERLQLRLTAVSTHPALFATLFVDVDGFKRVNDSLGHCHGDAVLIETARRISGTLPAGTQSFAARLSGDEFVVLLEGRSAGEVAAYAQTLQTALRQPVNCGEQHLFLSASIGIAMSTNEYTAAEDMLQDADLAMYRAKAAGTARCCFFTTSMRDRIRERMQIECELRRALAGDELVLHFQPKVLLATGTISGFEALVRWNHPGRGLLAPGVFIPVAEESDLILGIGRWTMMQAIRQLSVWRQEGILPPGASVAVNLSARQFADLDLVATIRQTLKAEALPAHCLRVEVTESALIEDTETALATLKELKALGIGLDLDDFGMGYSSLSYLHRFPFDTLKVDRSFIKDLGADHESSAIVRSVVVLGAALKLKVLAEGIETAEQADRLIAMGCLYGQGYYFSRPLSAADCTSLMRERAEPRRIPAGCSSIEPRRAPATIFALPMPWRTSIS